LGRGYFIVYNVRTCCKRGRVWDKLPKEVFLEDKTEMEQFKLIRQLEEDDRQTVLKIINAMLTKTKFKDFFNKNIAAL